MRLCRFATDRLGIVRGDHVLDVTRALENLPQWRYPLPRFDPLIANLSALRPKIEALADKAEKIELTKVELLSPIANPGKVVAAPVNYLRHLQEGRADPALHHQNPVSEIQRAGVFLKATSSVVGPSEGVKVRYPERRNDHEVELAAVIGKVADRVASDRALSYVAGYCIGLDMTVRGPEERSLRKSLDSFTVLGPWLVTADEFPDPTSVNLSIAVNGDMRQAANTRDLILSVAELVAYASSFYTLIPGDVLLTGTPEGVGPVHIGDVMHASIDHIGSMEVRVLPAEPVSCAG